MKFTDSFYYRNFSKYSHGNYNIENIEILNGIQKVYYLNKYLICIEPLHIDWHDGRPEKIIYKPITKGKIVDIHHLLGNRGVLILDNKDMIDLDKEKFLLFNTEEEMETAFLKMEVENL